MKRDLISSIPPLLLEELDQLGVLSEHLSVDLVALLEKASIATQVDLPLLIRELHQVVPSDDREAEIAYHRDPIGSG